MTKFGLKIKKETVTFDSSDAFTLQKRTLTGKAKLEGKTIRAGPSEIYWEFCFKDTNDDWRRFILDSNIIEVDSTEALEEKVVNLDSVEEWRDISFVDDPPKEIEPGGPGNPSKEMIEQIYPIDKGEIEFLTDNNTFKKFRLKGDKIEDLFAMKKEEGQTNLWILEVSEEVGTKR